MDRKKLYYILAAIGLFALYAIGAFTRSIWYDESITIYTLAAGPDFFSPVGLIYIEHLKPMLAGLNHPVGVVNTLVSDDVHPFVYFVSLDLWAHVFGNTILSARLFGVFVAVVAVFLFYQIMRTIRPGWAIASTAVFAFSSLLSSSAPDARYAATLILLTTLSILIVVRDAENEQTVNLKMEILLGAVVAGMMLTHYFATFVAVPIMLHRGLLLLSKRKLKYLIAPIVGILVFLPWLPVLIDHLGARPDQGNGFEGIAAWSKIVARRMAEIIVSPTSRAYPNPLVLLGQASVLALAGIGAIFAIRKAKLAPSYWKIEGYSLFVCGVGVLIFSVLYIVTDKWMSPMRYFASFLPFMVILTTFGLIQVGEFLSTKFGAVSRLGRIARYLPIAGFIALQGSMLNFGYESNAQRSGNYLLSIRNDIERFDPARSLVLIDPGIGRGDVLNAAISYAGNTEAFVLTDKTDGWPDLLGDFEAAIETRDHVWITYSITRGDFGVEKASIYTLFIDILEDQGFTRDTDLKADRPNFQAVWRRENNG